MQSHRIGVRKMCLDVKHRFGRLRPWGNRMAHRMREKVFSHVFGPEEPAGSSLHCLSAEMKASCITAPWILT